MKTYRLSFGFVNILTENIAEVIIDNNIVVSLEMVEEHDRFLTSIFNGYFGVLVNKINNYAYSPEAKLVMASIETMKAIASVNYSSKGIESTQDVVNKRSNDSLNIKTFLGLEMGGHNAYNWLTLELANNSLRTL